MLRRASSDLLAFGLWKKGSIAPVLPAEGALCQQKSGRRSRTTSSSEWEGKEAARPCCLYFCFQFCFEIKHITTPLQTTALYKSAL